MPRRPSIPASAWRRLTRVTVVTALALVAPTAVASPASAMPAQGVYEQCGPSTDGEEACLERLARIRQGGFKVVLNYTAWYSTPEQVRAYADRAHALGMKVIWPLNARPWREGGELRSHYRYLGEHCACGDNREFKDWAIGMVKDHPATWGYYIGDEARPFEAASVKALGAEVRGLDPRHPHLYVAHENSRTMGANLRPFADAADVLGADIYPVGAGESIDSVASISQEVQSIAAARGRRSAVVLQAFSWAQYPQFRMPGGRWPTQAELRKMRDGALRNSRPSLLLWYSFADLQRSDDPARRWQELVSAAFGPRGG